MKSILLALAFLLLIASCTSQNEIRKAAYPNLFDGDYDSEFPYRSSSEQLEEISNTIRLVNSIAFYRTYNFDKSDSITTESIAKGDYKKFVENSTSFEETASGTGSLVYNSGNQMAILTCAHIINFPDSVATYFVTPTGKNTGFVKNFSVIVKQDIYVVPFFEEGNFQVLVQDSDLDIAILTKRLKERPVFSLSTLNLPIGAASQLKWGTFVYVFGYPANYKMISKAIVSSPNFDKKLSFLIDAVANQGLSGGIVLAIRDGVPNFELVGMVRAAPAESEYVLRPHRDQEVLIGSEYEGPLVLDSRRNIKYGITKVLSIEAIVNFLEDHSAELIAAGLNPQLFFK